MRQWEWLPRSGCPQMLPRCCPAAVATGGVLRHVESDAGRSATMARMLPRGRRHDGGCLAREALQALAWERVFLKQQSPTQRKGGEAPGGLEGAVAELFFRPENAPLRGEACCPVPRRALGRRVGANRSLQRLCCAHCGTARAALVTISDCCKGLPLVELFLSERPAPPQHQIARGVASSSAK